MKDVNTRCKRGDICLWCSERQCARVVCSVTFSTPLAVTWAGCLVMFTTIEGKYLAIPNENRSFLKF